MLFFNQPRPCAPLGPPAKRGAEAPKHQRRVGRVDTDRRHSPSEGERTRQDQDYIQNFRYQ